jgi:actin-like ATPase involved in cell morphogenesis
VDGTILAIDMGTCYSSVAVLQGGQPITIPVGRGRDFMPSRVWIPDDGREALVGEDAQVGLPNGVLVQKFKPLLSVPARRVHEIFVQPGVITGYWIDHKCDAMSSTSESKRYLRVQSEYGSEGFHYSQDVVLRATCQLLAGLRAKAEARGLRNIGGVVLGCPVGFPDDARRLLVAAAVEAGLAPDPAKVWLFPEPLAVALRYGRRAQSRETLLIFDQGGSTLDLSVVTVGGTPGSRDFFFKVWAKGVVSRVSGEEFDAKLSHLVLNRCPQALERLAASPIARHSFMEEIERRKIELTDRIETSVQLTMLGLAETVRVSRDEFSATIQDCLARIKEQCLQVVQRAREAGCPELDRIVLAGGCARVPAVQALFSEAFPGTPVDHTFVGSGSAAEGLALVSQYPRAVDDLTEFTYSLWNPRDKQRYDLVTHGTSISSTSPGEQLQHGGGLDIIPQVGSDGKAVLTAVSTYGDRLRVVGALVVSPERGAPVRILGVVDPRTRLFTLQAVKVTGAGHELLPGEWRAGEVVPTLHRGNLVCVPERTFRANGSDNCEVGVVQRFADQTSTRIVDPAQKLNFVMVTRDARGLAFVRNADPADVRVYEPLRDVGTGVYDITELQRKYFRPLSGLNPSSFTLLAAPPTAAFEAAPPVPEPVSAISRVDALLERADVLERRLFDALAQELGKMRARLARRGEIRALQKLYDRLDGMLKVFDLWRRALGQEPEGLGTIENEIFELAAAVDEELSRLQSEAGS